MLKKLLKKAVRETLELVLHLQCKLKIKRVLEKGIIRLEIGAGKKKGEGGWVTLDINKKADLFWDLRNGIPFPDNSVDEIYTSHTFEHIPFEDLKKLIRECYRSLKHSGKLFVCVPSAKFYIDAYNDGRQFKSLRHVDKPNYKPCDTGSLIDQINFIAYMGNHRYMFDSENLVKILSLCGFDSVENRSFGHPLDKEGRDYTSIYATATKV